MHIRLSKEHLNGALEQCGAFYRGLAVNQQLYVNAAVALALFLFSSAIVGVADARGALLLFLAFWVAAILCDLITLYKKVYESVLGKGFILVLFSLCTNFSIAISSQVVNDIVGIDPSKFPHTVALLSILTIPFFAALGFGVLYFGVMAITPFLLMFHSLPDDKARAFLIPGYSVDPNIRYYKTTRAVQLISFAVFCGFAYGLSKKALHSYETFVTDSARSFLFGLEMYAKAPCTIPPGSRVAFIGDERVLLAEKTPAGMSFTIRDCKRGT